jgi:hypothetical protein
MPGMLNAEEMARLATGSHFDVCFSAYDRHHEGALTMVKTVFRWGWTAIRYFAFASDVDADQRMEISAWAQCSGSFRNESCCCNATPGRRCQVSSPRAQMVRNRAPRATFHVLN